MFAWGKGGGHFREDIKKKQATRTKISRMCGLEQLFSFNIIYKNSHQ
jgi:hypothetical protein